MTCRMAANKQKKRLINCTNSEQYRQEKKAKFDSSNNCLVTLKPHISLKWDQHQRRVVPEKEQVGILWSDLVPFIESQKHHSKLADVICVPPEIFSFESLKSVLSYEVWTTCLTEAERKFLIQFLPSGTDAEENVHSLLTGKNYHFGNPFLSWSSSACYGDIHPDAVLNKEKHIKMDEKAYRINLRNYHSNMVEALKIWRKRWLSCGDTENLFRDNPANQKHGVMQLKATKSGMPLKVAQSVDVSKFMSYIEISRTQLNHIKRLKQSGDGIQTKHVSRVIGGLDKSHVKPYGALLEDENRRLREHWLNMLCNDLPAAFEVLKEKKVLMEKSRKLLGRELEENVSVARKADQLTDIRKVLGQPVAIENDGSPILQNGQLEYSPQSILQGGDDQSTYLQDYDNEETKYVETSIYHSDNLNVKDPNLKVVNITSRNEQNSNAQDQDHKGIGCVDKGFSFCANNLDVQNEDLTAIKLCKDGLYVKDEDIKVISYKDTSLTNYSSDSPDIKSINYTCTPKHTVDSQNMQVQDLDGITYAGPSIHAHEQDQGLESISRAIGNKNGLTVNISTEMSHPKMNTTIVELEDTENTMMISSNSSLLPKLTGPLQSHYCPPENIMYNGSGDVHIRQSYLSSGQQSSSIYLDNGVLSQQQAQVTTSTFSMDNSASFVEPFSNHQNNGQLQTVKDIRAAFSNQQSNGQLQTVKDIVAASSLQHADSIEQSTGLHSLANSRLAQSAPFPRPLQDQQLIDQSDNGLYAQLHEDCYSDVSFPTNVNPPISEQHSYPAFAPMNHRYNWLPKGCQSHNNNFSGLESANYLTQTLPGGNNTDGTLFSAISQYKQPSVHLGHCRLSPSQLLETRNQVRPPQNFLPRTQDTNPPFPDMYGFTQNVANSSGSHAASPGSLDNMHWRNFIQQNPGMAPDFTNRQFRGPWTR